MPEQFPELRLGVVVAQFHLKISPILTEINKVNFNLYFDRIVAEGHRVDGATPRIEVWRGV